MIVVIKINNGELTEFEKDFLSKQYFANEINLKQGIEIILENYGNFRNIIKKKKKEGSALVLSLKEYNLMNRMKKIY